MISVHLNVFGKQIAIANLGVLLRDISYEVNVLDVTELETTVGVVRRIFVASSFESVAHCGNLRTSIVDSAPS